MKGKILLTGVSGNVGSAVVDYFKSEKVGFLAGVRNVEKSKQQDVAIDYIHFDFEDSASYGTALEGVTKVFLTLQRNFILSSKLL